jgi:NTE family protein
MILVDGMLTKNLPVEVARAMGADIIIAVNVGTPLLKREQLTSIVGVAGQMLSILTEQNVQASLARLKPTDILISPELGDFSTGDFDHLTEITPLGEAAARQVADRLAALSLPPAEYAALRKRQQVAMVPDLAPVDEIRFENLTHVNPEAAQGVMETRPGQPVVQAQVDADMRRLYGTGDFEHVNYRIVSEEGKRVLAIDAVEKAWGPDYLRLGLGLSSDFSGETYFSLVAAHRMTWLNSLGAEFRTDVILGYDNSLRLEFYQPLSVAGTFFVAPRASTGTQRVAVFQQDNRVAEYTIRSSQVGADLGLQFKQYGEFRLGLEGGRATPELDTGLASLDPGGVKYTQAGFRASLLLDRLDNAHFPRFGWNAVASIYDNNENLGADLPYAKWAVGGRLAHSFGENTVRLGVNAGGTMTSNLLPAYDQFQWGGFLQQSGFATGQLIGQNLQFGQLMFYRRIARGTFFDGAYGGLSLEVGKVGDPLVKGNPDGTLRSVAFFIGTDSLLGPVYLGYGKAEGGPDSFYFYLGKPL